ncbi:ADP-ribose pyrophosphatase, partial [Streptococcus thermophilus]|nr:ADP-ribose pyrophosphatase [Streptococcus thermophilus]
RMIELEQIADAKTIMAIWYWEMQHFKKEVEDNA